MRDMDDQEKLSSVDAAWLRMDRPTKLMMICGVLIFDGRLELQQLRSVIATRMLCFHRFRQRIVDQGLLAYWASDPHFDLDWHVRQIALPEPADRIALQNVVGDLISTGLDSSKPMWQFHLLDMADGKSALLLRIHHCYGDGFALMHVVMSMTDPKPGHSVAPGADVSSPASARATWERVLGPVTETVGDVGRLAGNLLGLGADWLAKPGHAVELAKTGLDLLAEAAVIASMKPDSVTRFKGPLGVMKRVAWTDSLSVFEVKAVAAAYSCSINDVLLACAAGALRSYLEAQGDAVDQLELRSLVPVNLRPAGPVTELGNHFGLVFLDLPVNVADPVARLLAVRSRMAHLKYSQQPVVALGILAGLGVAPAALRERILQALADNASAIMTNVPGFQEHRFLAGQKIDQQLFWVPQSGGIGIGISILSYAGKIDFGVVSDVKRMPDPDRLVALFREQFESLLLTALWQLCERDGAAQDMARTGM